MKIEKISNMTPMGRLLYWIKERQRISIRKANGDPKPWTDDEILQNYRFCNVKRIDDKVSWWLYQNWYDPHTDRLSVNRPRFYERTMLLACTLARQFNKIDTLEAIGFPDPWNPERTCAILEERAAKKLKNYSPAYMLASNFRKRGSPRESKVYQSVWRVCNPIWQESFTLDTDSMQNTWEALIEADFVGLSYFMAGQIVADLRWAVSGEWSDKDTWAPMGPGSQRGLNRLLGRPPKTPLTQEKFVEEMLEFYRVVIERASVSLMEAMDFQSCLCEWDKYERARTGEGKPKVRYNGAG